MTRIRVLPGDALLFLVIGLQTFGARVAAQEPPESLDDRVAWLRTHAIPLRTIDPADEDFSDLAPLAEVVEGVRIILLGEQSHADGATFVVKDRLVRFLHQQLGFDVLAFEANQEAMREADGRLHAGEAVDVVASFLVGMWGDSEYVRALLESVGETGAAGSPLRLAGFDIQVSGRSAYRVRVLETKRREFHDLMGLAAPSLVDEAVARRVASLLESDGLLAHIDLANLGSDARPFERARDDAEELSRRLSYLTPEDEGHSAGRLQRVLKNLLWGLEHVEHQMGEERPMWTAVRDEAMAENLEWLLEHASRSGRVIGWAHSGHIARQLTGIQVVDGSFSWEGEVPTGEHLSSRFGSELYSVGFLAYEGQAGQVFPDTAFLREIPGPDEGSLDWLLAQIDEPYLFLDLSSVPGDHWLRQEMIARPVYVDMRAVWPDVYDGFVFIREMFPNRRLNPLPGRQ